MSFEHHRRIGYWCGRISAAMKCRLEERTRHLGLTCTAAIVLVALRKHGPATLVELAHWLEHTHPSVLRQIDTLEESGFVRRVPHEHDRRMKIVQLTDKGNKAMPAIHRAMRALQADALAGFSEREVDQLMKRFQRIAVNLGLKEWPDDPPPSTTRSPRSAPSTTKASAASKPSSSTRAGRGR